jgi:hypothetical protein
VQGSEVLNDETLDDSQAKAQTERCKVLAANLTKLQQARTNEILAALGDALNAAREPSDSKKARLLGLLNLSLNLVDEMGFEPTTSSLRTRNNLR